MGTGAHAIVSSLLSLILPGSGQIYNHEPAKGAVICGACLGLAAAAIALPGPGRVSATLLLLAVWTSSVIDAYKVAKARGCSPDWYYRVPYVVAMLLLVGPLALPLLWRSPYFSRPARWIWTALIAVSLLLVTATPYWLRSLGVNLPGS